MALLAMLAGCASQVERQISPSVANNTAVAAESTDSEVPVVRHGRYTLIELRPEASQRDLSLQVVDVAMPAHLSPTVGDGVQHLLQRTGYSACHTSESSMLYAFPLPAAHLRLGPMTLRDALQTLAGPAWLLSFDEGARQVCFIRKSDPIELVSAGVAP
ncbi:MULTISPECIES: PilL N-terminal domain-containing protein [Burkholderia]|uniref:PFGI-1 class ICE element type IV pilus protein PilL2 n=1 Tax=Burkholderia TaxID=32008 RepID=UPI001FD78A75|nr:PilL N-terminal domain-containing protein [Burkholderia sp. AcTa6-5]